MNLNDPQANGEAKPATGRAVILTSYQTRLPGVKRLGLPGYSYDIVARLLVPLLERWGEVVPAPLDPIRIEEAIAAARQRGQQPIHLSVLPFQDVYLTRSAPNVVFPFWEFPDVPAETFDGNPQNNWVATANRCDLVLVCGPFTDNALQRAGIRTPIHIVPVPTAREHFQLPPWSAETTTRIACSACVFPNDTVPPEQRWDAPDRQEHPENRADRPSLKRALLGRLRQTYRQMFKPLVPPIVHKRMRDRVRPMSLDPWQSYLRGSRREEVELSGIVYTSIFSPQDGRKNRDDLISGFLAALRDCDDATLVVKLAAPDMLWIDNLLNYYRTAGLGHRCKVVFITDYLSDEQMLALIRASTYYLTTTRAEGCCLPLLDYLAAGRPGVAPCHTAISDYFYPEMGFIMGSAPERAIWPQDKRVRFKTMWNRIVWSSVVEQIRHSYEVARNEPSVYASMAAAARERVARWAEPEIVWPRLRAALDSVDTRRAPLAA